MSKLYKYQQPEVNLIDYKLISSQLSAVVLLVIVISVIVCFLINAVYMIPVALVSGILCLGVILLSLVLTWVRSKKGLIALVKAFMFSQFIRLFLGTVVVVIMVLAIGFNVRVTVGWVLGWYWLLLALEVWILQKMVSKSIYLSSLNSKEDS